MDEQEGRKPPAVLPYAMDLYAGFYDVDRDFNGNLTFAGMNAVIACYGFLDDEFWVRSLWRAMDSARRDEADRLREKKRK